MTSNVQYVLSELCGEKGIGKKKMQKLTYLLKRKGLDLGMRYGIHFYGPYSSDLNEEIYSLQAQGYLDINTKNKTHIISAAEKIQINPLEMHETQILREVISEFGEMSAHELELLTTADYVANSMLEPSALTKEKIIEMVRQIKGSKFDEAEIGNCIDTLCKDNFFHIVH